MTPATVTITCLEKAAADNGFDLDPEHTADWLSFGSSRTSMHIWLTTIEESRFLGIRVARLRKRLGRGR